MRLTIPLRTPTTHRAGVADRRRKRGAKGHGDRRKGTVLLRRVRVRPGDELKIIGQVKRRDGQPLAGAEVQILSRGAASPEQRIGVARTDGSGRYVFVTRAQSNSILRMVYAGSPTTLPSQREVTVLVSAASTIRARPRQVRNGQAVTFVGRLRSLPAPAAGKLVELQVVLSGRWQTFRTIRSGPDGTWHVRYRFRRSCGLLRYRFRALVPAETGYPFGSGHTRALGVRVRGAPCR